MKTNKQPKEILTEHEKEQARQTAIEVIKTIATLGLNHFIKWIISLINNKN